MGEPVCPECGADLPQEGAECAACELRRLRARVPVRAHGKHERRYVYHRRKDGLSNEAIWLLVVVGVGLLIIVLVQLISFLRDRKWVEAPTPVMVQVAWLEHRWGPEVFPLRREACRQAPETLPRAVAKRARTQAHRRAQWRFPAQRIITDRGGSCA